MKLRSEDTKQSFDNCNFEFGIEFGITGFNDESISAVKRLKSMAEGHGFEGSLDQFLTDYAIGYMDAAVLGCEREMKRLPAICGSCESNESCYVKTDKSYKKSYRKKEPQ